MDRRAHLEYMNKLEQKVIVPGLERGLFGKATWLPIRNGKLHSAPFAELLGTRFFYAEPAVIEYYGLQKRSTGFMAKATRLGAFLKGFKAPLVSFASVHAEHIKELAPELHDLFPEWKAAVVQARFGAE